MVVAGGSANLNARLATSSSGPPSQSAGCSTAKSRELSPSAAVVASQTETQHSAGTAASGWIGVTTKDDARGVVITRVLSSSSASDAGLQEGDVIIELNGKRVKSGMEFDVAITRSEPGSNARIAYIRNGSRLEANVKVGKMG
jgi:S1-C subfamily serine protease